MLRELRIGNLAVAEDLVVPLGPGLTMLTGETGAGKSLIAGALALLSGARASRDQIRRGEDEAFVEAVFELADDSPVRDAIARSGVRVGADGVLVLRRELRREGRGRVVINGLTSSLALLEQLGQQLLAVQSQDQQRVLSASDFAIDFLDRALGLDERRELVVRSLAAWQERRRELGARQAEVAFAREQQEMWSYQRRELQEAALNAEEAEDLAERLAVGRNARAVAEAAAQARQLLSEGEVTARELLGQALGTLAPHESTGRRLQQIATTLTDAAAAVDDAARELERFLDGIEVDPQALDELEERKSLYEQLQRKYDRDVPGLLALQEDLEERLRRTAVADEDLRRLHDECDAAAAALGEAVSALRRERQQGAPALAARARDLIRPLGLPDLELEFRVEPSPGDAGDLQVDGRSCAVGARGGDRVQMLARTNPGEARGEVRRIASGGERSRIFLGLSVLARPEVPPVLTLYDEIDAGVGMDQATAVVGVLNRLATQGQVLCITHLPTVAARGHDHLQVSKRTAAGRTSVVVRRLVGEERVREIVRLLGGVERDRTAPASREAYARDLIAGGPLAAAANEAGGAVKGI